MSYKKTKALKLSERVMTQFTIDERKQLQSYARQMGKELGLGEVSLSTASRTLVLLSLRVLAEKKPAGKKAA